MFSLFLLAVVGQSFTGFHEFKDDEKDHGQPPIRFSEYLVSGHFVESIFENWESEFLQMASYVFLTAFSIRRGRRNRRIPTRRSRWTRRNPDDRRRTLPGRCGAAGSPSRSMSVR